MFFVRIIQPGNTISGVINVVISFVIDPLMIFIELWKTFEILLKVSTIHMLIIYNVFYLSYIKKTQSFKLFN